MKKITWIKVKTSFQAQHCWPACPHKEVSFLRTPHRHTFNVVVKMTASHDDREKEFFMVQNLVNEIISYEILEGASLMSNYNIGSLSCEQICDILYENLQLRYLKTDMIIEVNEDGENGAEVEYTVDEN